jgi:HK97 family phage major capsid protein
MEPIQEIKTLVSDMGTAFEEFKHSHGTLKDEVKKLNTEDVVLKEKIAKLADEITAKHEAAQKQLDALKAQSERPDYGKSGDEQKKVADEAMLFTKSVLSANNKPYGEDVPADIEGYKAYSGVLGKYLRKGEKVLDLVEHKALSSGSDPDGGYLVRPVYATGIIERIFESSPMRQLASVQMIGTDEYKILQDPNEADAGWVGETQERPQTNTPQVSEKSIFAHEVYAKPRASQKNLEDAFMNVEAWLARKVADKFARMEATAFVSGNGVAKPRGILTYTAGTAWGQIEQVVSTSNGAFTYAGLLNVMTSLKEPFHSGASWLTRRQSVASIMLLTDGDGRYIFQPILTGNFNQTPLLGYTLRYATDMPAVATDALAMAFGNFGEGYQIVDRIGISVLRDPFSAKPHIEFYARRRVGGDVVNFDAIKLLKLSAS